jgi:hypothetical protein
MNCSEMDSRHEPLHHELSTVNLDDNAQHVAGNTLLGRPASRMTAELDGKLGELTSREGDELSTVNLDDNDQRVAGNTLLGRSALRMTTELDGKVGELTSCEGGELLRVSACLASHHEDPPEWCMGQLFIGTEGFLFFSSGPPSWSIGPAKWVDVAFVGQVGGKSDEPCILLRDASGVTNLLSGIDDFRQVEEIWRQSRERWGATCENLQDVDSQLLRHRTLLSLYSHSVDVISRVVESRLNAPVIDVAPNADTHIEASSLRQPSGHLLASSALHNWLGQWPEECATSELEVQRAKSLHESKSKDSDLSVLRAKGLHASKTSSSQFSMISRYSQLSVRTFFVAADELPDLDAGHATTTFTTRLYGATISGIQRAFTEHDLLKEVSSLHFKATDLEVTPWVGSRRVPGTHVRRLRCRFPLPGDIPSAAKKAVHVPDVTAVTVLTRVGGHVDKFVILQQACSHDMPYGERVWLQESCLFRPDLEGGVLFEKSVKSIWVRPLPWALSMCGVKAYIEHRAQADSELSGKFMAKRLQNAA